MHTLCKSILSMALVCGVLALPVSEANAQHIRALELEFSNKGIERLPDIDEESGVVNLFVNEPFFKKVEFKTIEPAYGLQERVERILYGLYTDVPPEYDHYGYEIRRYMASIGNANSINNPNFIAAQLKNIKNASIILDYWQKSLKEEMDEIDQEITDSNNRTNIRTIFKYNRGVATAFFVEQQNWMNNNKMLLEYLQEIGPRAYKYHENGVLTFKNKEHLRRFSAIYRSKLISLRQIREYLPFRMMIY